MCRGTLGVAAILLCLLPGSATASVRWFGFNDNATLTHDLTPAEDARLLARTGATSARITVDWSWAERKEGRLELGMYDPVYNAWISRGTTELLQAVDVGSAVGLHAGSRSGLWS